MTNSDSGGDLTQQIITTIAREFAWRGFPNTPLQRGEADTTSLSSLPGRYELDTKEIVAIRTTAGAAEVLDLTSGWTPLYALSDGTFGRSDRDVRYVVTPSGLDVVMGAATPAGTKRQSAARLAADAPLTGDELLSAGAIDEALAAYRAQFAKEPASINEANLNRAGYTFLYAGRTAQSLALLKLNTELFPTSANAWDSYGEALATAGETAKAISAYEEVIRKAAVDPKLDANTRIMFKDMAEARLKALRNK